MGHGAVAFTDEEGAVRFILNHEYLRDLAQGALQSDISKAA
jgi:hypothetical protein